MKKENCFGNIDMAKLSQWPWILQALARPSRQETYRNKLIVSKTGLQFDQSALADARLRS